MCEYQVGINAIIASFIYFTDCLYFTSFGICSNYFSKFALKVFLIELRADSLLLTHQENISNGCLDKI